MLVVRPASATRDALVAALRETFGQSLIARERVKLDLPLLAESGNVVPVTVSVDSPMTASDHVVAIHLFAERNRLPAGDSSGFWQSIGVIKTWVGEPTG